jgi:enoyl-CoA hydratase/carnithine racemase
MEFQDISLDIDGPIATLTLHRPDKLNSFTPRMMYELISAFDVTDANDAVRAVIVTGAGRAFCAGADLSSGGETFAKGGSDVRTKQGIPRDGGGLVALRIFNSLKPVIGAINGAAVGVGATMTLPMDIRLASDTAKFGFVFAKRGIVPEACSSYFLPRIVGIQQATEWVFTGRLVTAVDAHAARLVRSVHTGDELLEHARTLAQEIAENTAPVSVAMSRQMLWRMLGASHPMDAHRVDSRGIMERGKSADSKEGVISFLEKRPAQYPDRVSDGLPNIFPNWQEPDFF